jgi:hypothetical protein
MQLLGRHAGDDIAAVAAIDPKVGIDGQQQGIRQDLRHSHQAGIARLIGRVSYFFMSARVESTSSASPTAMTTDRRRASAAKAGAPRLPRRQNASDKAASHVFHGREERAACAAPVVVSIEAAEQRYKKARVNEDVCSHIPSPAGTASCERSDRAAADPPIR